MKGIHIALGLVAVSAIFLNSCIKQSFDNPQDLTTFDPNLTVNVKLKDLVAPFLGNTAGKNRILGDSTIYGIVTADDRSGNFYKQIINKFVNNCGEWKTWKLRSNLKIQSC